MTKRSDEERERLRKEADRRLQSGGFDTLMPPTWPGAPGARKLSPAETQMPDDTPPPPEASFVAETSG